MMVSLPPPGSVPALSDRPMSLGSCGGGEHIRYQGNIGGETKCHEETRQSPLPLREPAASPFHAVQAPPLASNRLSEGSQSVTSMLYPPFEGQAESAVL